MAWQSHAFVRPRRSRVTSTCLHGIQEWRDEAMKAKFARDSLVQPNSTPTASDQSSFPATIPILPFPFTDILLQGQSTQLNLFEERFHDLFDDSMMNHHGMVAMGLLAGNGMITTMPLCEVSSFTRVGADANFVPMGDGMGNGSILVSIRCVGRCKINEPKLMQEEPYMVARVVETVDDDIAVASGVGGTGLKDNFVGPPLRGESSPLQIGNMLADKIDQLMESISDLEDELRQKSKKKKKEKESDSDSIMNRQLVNAQLESLFAQDSTEGVLEESQYGEDETEYDDDDDEEELFGRYADYKSAVEDAMDADSVFQQSNNDNLASPDFTLRSGKELVATSWAAFCTGGTGAQAEIMKIQALDMTAPLQRLQLASAMLREEQKKLQAKLMLSSLSRDDEKE
ncbi:hypothetical protein THAOC_07496 [Thalassiosira oceanica]|uniref:Lon N-terminal domain-containing protein n=1 Tax=Thalassiosira oceanica TaxID=159749 RepID=K0TKB6_THAOC|nr:hypothetical protein THAOC_07496 [Thalassiosira oceanica]|eukprot:EJK71097.1 hypothetical protein THAOC_07496 [Thalassiosira oceanica]